MNEELVNKIHDRVSDVVDEVEKSEVEEKVEEASNYGLSDEDVERTVVHRLANEYDVDKDEFTQSGGNETVTVEEVKEKEDGEWVSLRVKFDESRDLTHENMVQHGIVGDETGRVRFVSWENSEPPELEEGESYHIENVVTDEYQGSISITFTPNTEVDRLDEDVEVEESDDIVEVRGALVDFQSGSGLIKRCTEEGCTRVLQNGNCREHGDVEGEFDMRIKGVLDDGTKAHELILDKELTRELTGIDMGEAKDIAMEELDRSAVSSHMKREVVGKYYEARGVEAGRYILVDEINRGRNEPDKEQLLVEVQGDNND